LLGVARGIIGELLISFTLFLQVEEEEETGVVKDLCKVWLDE